MCCKSSGHTLDLWSLENASDDAYFIHIVIILVILSKSLSFL